MADGNNIQTTMTLDQQQFMREMAKQVGAIAKSARAFVEFKQEAQRAGQGMNSAFEAGAAGAQSLLSSITGITGGVGLLLAAVKLVTAEWRNVKDRQDDALAALALPAKEARNLKFNFNPDASMDLADIEPTAIKIAKKTETPVEQVLMAWQNASSGKGSLTNAEAVPFVEEAFRMYPADVGSASAITDAGLDLAKVQNGRGGTIDARAINAWLGRVQVTMRTTNMKDTAKVLSPVTAAGQASGDSPRYMATLLSALTQRMGAGSHEQAATSLGGFIQRIKKFDSESDQDRTSRMVSYVQDVLGTIDLPGRNDAKKKLEIKERLGLIKERNVNDPEAFAREAQELISDVKKTVGEQTVYGRRLATASERIQKARTTLVDENEHGNQIDLPIEAVKEFQQAQSTEQRKRVIQKFPILLEALMPELKSKMNVLARPHIEAFLFDKPEMMAEVKAAGDQIPDISDALIPEHEQKLRDVSRGGFEPLAGADRRSKVSEQTARLAKSFEARQSDARVVMEDASKDAGVGWLKRTINAWEASVHGIDPFRDREHPEKVAIRKLEMELVWLNERLKKSKSPADQQSLNAGRQRLSEAIENLKKTASQYDESGQVRPSEPVKDEQPVPAGQKVGSIGSPLIPGLGQFLGAASFSAVPADDAPFTAEEWEAAIEREWGPKQDMAAVREPDQQPVAMPFVPAASNQSGRNRIREDVIEQALATASAESVPGVTREGLNTTADLWGDDTAGFANKVKEFFHGHAERRREEAANSEVDVEWVPGEDNSSVFDPVFDLLGMSHGTKQPGEWKGTPFKDPSVDRLFQAGTRIGESPTRELLRTDRQRAAIGDPGVGVPIAAEVAPDEFEPQPLLAAFEGLDPRPLQPFDAAGFMAEPEAVAAEEIPHVATPETSFMLPQAAKRPRILPKPFVPSDPDRHAKAIRAVEASKSPRPGSKIPDRKPFVPSDTERTAKAWAAVDEAKQPREPTINVQGGDTKPVVGEIKNGNQILEQLLGEFKGISAMLKNQQPQQASRGGRERTSTRPAAALAAR